MNTRQITTYRIGASWDKQVGGEVHIRDLTPMSVSMPIIWFMISLLRWRGQRNPLQRLRVRTM